MLHILMLLILKINFRIAIPQQYLEICFGALSATSKTAKHIAELLETTKNYVHILINNYVSTESSESLGKCYGIIK